MREPMAVPRGYEAGIHARRVRRSMCSYSHPAVVQVTSVHQQAQVKAPCTHDRREADPDGFTLREALVRQRRNVAGQVPRSRSGDALRHGAAKTRTGKERPRFGERSLVLAGAPHRARREVQVQVMKISSSSRAHSIGFR
jgi:hypothetical protein